MSAIMGIHYTADWNATLLFMAQPPSSRVRIFIARYVFQTAVYMIWKERNSRKHGEHLRTLENLCRTIDRLVKNIIMSLKGKDKSLESAFQLWITYVRT